MQKITVTNHEHCTEFSSKKPPPKQICTIPPCNVQKNQQLCVKLSVLYINYEIFASKKTPSWSLIWVAG